MNKEQERHCKVCGKLMDGPFMDGIYTDRLYGEWVDGVYSIFESKMVTEDTTGDGYFECEEGHQERVEVSW